MPSIQRKSLLASLWFAGAMAFVGPVPPANAASATATFQVTATVQAMCLISATSLNFGTYTGAQTDATSTISVTCTNSTPYNVGLDGGTAVGASTNTRKMTGPAGALLTYALYRDSARTSNWGTATGTDTVVGTGSGSAQTLTVYGRLATAQFAAPGAYTDTITATITY